MNPDIYKLISQLRDINVNASPSTKKTFKCCCHRFFSNQQALQQHFTETHMNADSVAKVSAGNSIHKCSNCNRIFLKEIDLMKHFSTTHLFQLPMNHSPSSSRSSSQLHINTLILAPKADNVTTSSIKCKFCNKHFNNNADLKQHTEAVHKDIVCSICEKSFMKKEDFNQHFKASHSKPKQSMGSNVLQQPTSSKTNSVVFPCFMCAKVFATKNDMMKHASATNHIPKTISNSGKPTSSQPAETGVICKYCNVKFNRPADLKQHTEAKHNVVCSVCKKSFAKQIDYHQHYKASHSKKLPSTLDDFVCSICKQGFHSGDDLLAHIRQKHSSSTSTTTSTHCPPSTNLLANDQKEMKNHCDQKSQDPEKVGSPAQPAHETSSSSNAATFFKYSFSQNNWKDHIDNIYNITSESAKLEKIFSISQPTILSVSVKTQIPEIFERCLTIIKMLASDFKVVSINKHKNDDCKTIVIYCNSFHIFNVQYPASVYIHITPLPTIPALD